MRSTSEGTPPTRPEYILHASCPAGIGIVAAVATFLAERDCAIRAEFESTVATRLDMGWKIFDPLDPVRTVIMVSKTDHCLDDLLYRRRTGELNLSITAVVSNHLDLRPMVEREGIRFIFLPVTRDNKAQQEARLLEIVDETDSELVILARYMQILSDGLARRLAGKCINIHHSFLPGFKGAKPYQQAFDRGVKLIGATAHYATPDLDEGPIIEQVLTRVDHNYRVDQLTRVGRDNECLALATAVKFHIERRVFVDGNKTVVFRGP